MRLSRGSLIAGAVFCTAIGFQLIACSSDSSSSGGDERGGSSAATGSQPGSGGKGSSSGLPGSTGSGGAGSGNGTASGSSGTAPPASDDDNCGATTNELVKKPADLLLVLDRSSSMTRAMDSSNNCSATSTTCKQRWATMISSLTTVLDTSSADVYWGLKFFTSPAGANGSACYVSSGVEVAVAPNNAATIQAQINEAGTSSYTPTRVAIETAVTYLDTVTDSNPKYILLATDGEPNCAPGVSDTRAADLEATIEAAQAAADAGYKVFVIGVGPEVGNLTAMAVAGGTTDFYPATTPEQLSEALESIVGTVAAGCTYPVGATEVVNPNAIGVYLDKALVPQSATDGWSIDATNTTITLNGSYCASVTSGEKSVVQIFLPCKATDPLPPVLT